MGYRGGMSDRPPELLGIPIKEIQRICKVSLKTARRWKAGQNVPPESALMMLRGDLGCFDSAWEGWCLRNGKLISPENWIATPGDVLAIQLTQAQLSTYRNENRHLKADLAEALLQSFEEQPLPSQWEIATG